jgi:Ni/Co efflux regulator RcnB
MKTKIAAIAVLLLAGTAPAALAQEHGDHHHERPDQSGGERTPHDVGGRPAEQHMFRPQAQPQQAPRVAPAQTQPQGGERWRGGGGGAPGADRSGGWRRGGPSNFNGGAPQSQPQAPAQPQRDWRGDRGGDHRGDRGDRSGDRGGDHRPQVDSWGGERNGYRGGDRRDGDHAGWNGREGDHRDGDRRGGDHRDWRGGERGDHRGPSANHPRWSPGHYPHAYRSGHRYHWRPYLPPVGFYAHSWAYGEILPQAWFSPEYVIEDWWDFGLPEPPYGYDWVRVGDDGLLIYEGSGEVVQVVRDLFW